MYYLPADEPAMLLCQFICSVHYIVKLSYIFLRFTTFQCNKIDTGHFGTGQNRRRPKPVQAKIGAEKNEPTWLYSALIKKNSCVKLIVLRLMVTCYIGNMIVCFHCHYAYLSITITSKLSALNHNKILYYCNCYATICSSVHIFGIFFVSCENKLSHYKQSHDLRCITPGIVQFRLCENATLISIKQLHKITFY